MRDRERGESVGCKVLVDESAGCKVLVAERERRGGDRERREDERGKVVSYWMLTTHLMGNMPMYKPKRETNTHTHTHVPHTLTWTNATVSRAVIVAVPSRARGTCAFDYLRVLTEFRP